MTLKELKEIQDEKTKLTTIELAEVLGVSADTVRKGIIDGVLKCGVCVRGVHNTFIIPTTRVIAFLEGKL